VEDVEARLSVTFPNTREVMIRLDAGGARIRQSNTWVRMDAGLWLHVIHSLGADQEPRGNHLPYGEYEVKTDFGDPTVVHAKFTVQPGKGPLEVVVHRPPQ